MKKYRPNFSFLFIIVLVLLCLTVNLTTPFSLNVGPVHYKFPGIDLKKMGFTRDISFHRGLDLEPVQEVARLLQVLR